MSLTGNSFSLGETTVIRSSDDALSPSFAACSSAFYCVKLVDHATAFIPKPRIAI
jgi:hypothetical protein